MYLLLSTEPHHSFIFSGTETHSFLVLQFCLHKGGLQLLLSHLQHLFLGPEQRAYLKKTNILISQKEEVVSWFVAVKPLKNNNMH